MTINIFHCFFVFSWQLQSSSPVIFLETSFQNTYFVFSNFEFIACSVWIQTLIVPKQLQLFHNYTTKIWLAYVSESRNLPYWAIIIDHSLHCFIMSLVAMNDFHLIFFSFHYAIFHQMISISDCLHKLGCINCRGEVEDTRLEAKAKNTKKSEAKAKDSLSENRPSQGQGQKCSRPRTQA